MGTKADPLLVATQTSPGGQYSTEGGILSFSKTLQSSPEYPGGQDELPQIEGMILSTPPTVLSYPDHLRIKPSKRIGAALQLVTCLGISPGQFPCIPSTGVVHSNVLDFHGF